MQMEQKTALVTGASRGIGKQVAIRLAEEGYDIAFCHFQDEQRAKQTKQQIQEQFNRKCVVFNVDLRQTNLLATLVKEVISNLGSIHTLVNNAGITIFHPITEMEVDELDHLINLDLKAPLTLMSLIGQHMKECHFPGNIINITSTRAERAYPDDAVYGAVKAGLRRATESVALELSDYGIRVNCVAPGAIQVDSSRDEYYQNFGQKIPLARAGQPNDVAEAVCFLVSERASYITGTTVRVDGGLILPGMPETSDKQSGWKQD